MSNSEPSTPRPRWGAGLRVIAVGVAAASLATVCGDGSSGDADPGDSTSSTVAAADSAAPLGGYTVVAGDTLSGIAASAGVALADLVAANGWPDGVDHAIFPGDVIALPAGAVVVAPARPSTTRPSGAATVAPTIAAGPTTSPAAPTPSTAAPVASGGYTPVGAPFSGPDLGDRTSPVTSPLTDGVYWAWDATASPDGSTVTWRVGQAFFGAACAEHFGTAPDSCLDDYDVEADGTASASMATSTGAVTVVDPMGQEAYHISGVELARLVAGRPPAADAPPGYAYVPFPFVLTVSNGTVTAADQRFVS